MPISQFEEIHKEKVEYRVYESYKKEIHELETLGFDDLHITREVVFPLSALFLFWVYPALKFGGEIFTIEKPLRYVVLNPLTLNYEYDTYVHVFKMGVMFFTLFKGKGMLVSCNYVLTSYNKPKQALYRYSAKSSISQCFVDHKIRIAEMENAGMVTDDELSLLKFELAMAHDTKASLTPF